MLYVQCTFCRSIGPLVCAGVVFPHVPLATVTTPYGATCPGCGNVMSAFVCAGCARPQLLLAPGVAAPAPQGWGAPQSYAPVVQAEQGASESTLKSLFRDLLTPLAQGAGNALSQSLFGSPQQSSVPQQPAWGQW